MAKQKREFQMMGIVQVGCPFVIPFVIALHCKMEILCNRFTHTGVIISTVLLLSPLESGSQICNYFEEHADALLFIYFFLISPPEIRASVMNVFAPQLWSDQSLHVSGNNVAQKAALSLSDKHQTVWGREEVQNIFYVENWKAFIKWLSLVKGFILLFFPPFGFFEEKSLFKHPPRCFTLFWVFLLWLLTYVKRLMAVAVTEAGLLHSCLDVNTDMPPQSAVWWGPNTNKTVNLCVCVWSATLCVLCKTLPLSYGAFTIPMIVLHDCFSYFSASTIEILFNTGVCGKSWRAVAAIFILQCVSFILRRKKSVFHFHMCSPPQTLH